MHQLCTHRSQVQTLANKCEFPPSHLWCRIRGFHDLNSITISGSWLNLTPAKLSKLYQSKNNTLDILVLEELCQQGSQDRTKEPLDPHQCHRMLRPNWQDPYSSKTSTPSTSRPLWLCKDNGVINRQPHREQPRISQKIKAGATPTTASPSMSHSNGYASNCKGVLTQFG